MLRLSAGRAGPLLSHARDVGEIAAVLVEPGEEPGGSGLSTKAGVR